jgi:hypothetical protein
MGRRLERHVDWDLTDRILASGRVKKVNPPKTTKKPRASATYRGARRNAPRVARAAALAAKRA